MQMISTRFPLNVLQIHPRYNCTIHMFIKLSLAQIMLLYNYVDCKCFLTLETLP